MALSFKQRSGSTAAFGATSAATAFPVTGLAAGDLFVALVVAKLSDTVSFSDGGFTRQITHVAGTGGGNLNSDGDVRIEAWTKVADGSETGNLTASKTTESGTVLSLGILRFRATSGAYDLAVAAGTDADGNSSWSVAAGTDPGIAQDDYIVVANGMNDNVSGVSSRVLSASGAAFSEAASSLISQGTAMGNDLWAAHYTFLCTSGPASAAPTFSGTITAGPEGGTVFLRIREGAGGGGGETVSITKASFGFTTNPLGINAKEFLPLTKVAFGFTAKPLNINAKEFISLTKAAFGFTGRPVDVGGSEVVPLGKASFAITGGTLNINAREHVGIAAVPFEITGKPVVLNAREIITLVKAGFTFNGRWLTTNQDDPPYEDADSLTHLRRHIGRR